MLDRMAEVATIIDSDHVRGATAPVVTLIEYGDYDCPHTRKAQATVDRLMAENPDLRVVFRHFPLRHKHVRAEALARVAEAATRQGKFWPLHDRLMHHRSPVEEGIATADAADAGLDLVALAADAADPVIAARIQHDVDVGGAAGVHSTPSFFFNGVLHDGHYDLDTLNDRLRMARAAAGR